MVLRVVSLVGFAFLFASIVNLQAFAAGPQRGQGGQAARPPREAAPIDLTGYWVSVVSEDWRFRMTMAQKGDWDIFPLTQEGLRVAEAANPAAEDPCKAYGAAGIMRIPGRLNITWENDSTLRIDTDSGQQRRTLRFGQSTPPPQPVPQGHSIAAWEGQNVAGKLKVVTTHMTPGYYFKHGVPYSGNAIMRETFWRITEANGDQYLLVTTQVDDPQYLSNNYLRTLLFKKEPDGSKWKPTPCQVP